VRALGRRAGGAGQPLATCGLLAFDVQARLASVAGERLELTARELRLLEIFMARVGRIVNKAQIVDHLCEWGEEVSENAVEVYVHRLRRKLEPAQVRIATVRGLGYCLEALPPA
jgi:two-component system OmpR family response regulator